MLYSFRNRAPSVGKDSYVSEHAVVIGDVRIGDGCYIGHGAILRADYGSIEVGDGTAVEEGVIVHAGPDSLCRIGAKVTIGHGAIVHSARIGDFAVIGMGAILSIRSEVGEGTIVAEGALIKWGEKVAPGLLVGGSPVRELRKITDAERKMWDAGKQMYIDLAAEYLRDGMRPVPAENGV